MQVGSDMEGHTLPATLLPQLKSITLDISNGQRMGLWSAKNLALLGATQASPDCTISVEADAAILHLSQLHNNLAESGLLPRVRKLSQQSWGLSGGPAHFGKDVEVNLLCGLIRTKLQTKCGCSAAEVFWNPAGCCEAEVGPHGVHRCPCP